MNRKYKRNKTFNLIVTIVVLLLFVYIEYNDNIKGTFSTKKIKESYEISNIPDYNGEDYIIINHNEPEFDDLAKTDKSFEVYSGLDSLGRCGVAYANIGKDLMPTSERERINMIKPSGFNHDKYDIITDGKYLYNRCHLIAFQLTGENANSNNLITCTRHMNADVMTIFENMVGNYIRKTNNHVLYRVTPIFDGDNLVAKGVQMEALSIEDNGKSIKFNVFVYNVQPNIEIDYKTGKSKLIEN